MKKDPDLEKILGPLEAEVVRTVWAARRPISVRDMLERLNAGRKPALAYTTVMTVMTRLGEKGILKRRAEGRSFLYEATARDAAEIAVRGVVRDFGDAAISHFVEEARSDPRLLRRLERLLREEK